LSIRKDYFYDIVEVLHLLDDDCRIVGLVVPPDGGWSDLARVDGDCLEDAIAAKRLDGEVLGCLLASVGSEKRGDAVAYLSTAQ
jgi:hypothetical protein